MDEERNMPIKKNNKNKKRILYLALSLFLCLGVSLAAIYFMYQRSGEKQGLTTGLVTIDFAGNDSVVLNGAFPVTDEVGMANPAYEFSLTNTSVVPINATIEMILDESNTMPASAIRYALYEDEVLIKKSNLGEENLIIYEGRLNAGQKKEFKIIFWIDFYYEESNKTFKASFKATGESFDYIYTGANPPIMSSNMIPIKWDGSKWVKADKNNIGNDWYNYENKIWANAVTVKETGTLTRENYLSATVGTEIKEEDILTYFVWIPRYKYTIFNGNNEGVEEQEIKIVFETGITSTGTVSCTIADNGTETCTDTKNGSIKNGTSTYTHPAFTFGSDDVTGIWVGKFETTGTIGAACTNTNCTTGNLTIKPDETSLRSKTISNMYYATRSMNRSGNEYGFSNAEVDTHMMKNMEWGAVAYLTQSKYGRCTGGTCLEVSINNSSEYYTGRSGGAQGGSNATYVSFFGTGGTERYNTSGYYTYNDKKITCTGATCTFDSTIDNYTVTEVKEEGKGTSASTTGNIYGVYDMSGGAYDYVMGNMVDGDGAFYPSSSGFNNTSIMYPESKYYDRYVYDSLNTTHNRGHLGDATRETLKTYGSGTGGWYNDYAYFPNSTPSWFSRGGDSNLGTFSGSFSFRYGSGGANSSYGWRTIFHIK